MMKDKKDIGSRLREIAKTFSDDAYYKEDCSNNFLGDSSGAVLFLLHYAKLYGDETVLPKAADLFAKIAYAYNSGYAYPPSLAKFLFMASHAKGLGQIEVDEYPEEDLKLLQSYLRRTASNFYRDKNFDILHGGLGNGIFLFKSGDVLGVKEMVDGIKSLAESDKNGLKWYSLSDYKKNRWTYNLGFAHGMSSIVVMLSKAYLMGVERERCAELIEGAVNYILAQKLPKGNHASVFGNYALESMEQLHSSRLAWCYGDLGIAVALWRASQALGRKDWEGEAKALLRHASNRRDLKGNGVTDACFCHGTSGIAHIFNRMWRETGMPECKDAAAYWIGQTLKMAKFEDGLAGYKTRQGAERGFRNEYGLLEGIAGIGLVLLAHLSDEDPAWDECLLLS